jgi:ABC-2 type transport system permease protein
MTATVLLSELPISPHLKVTQRRVIRSEWTKFRTLRSTIITLAVAVILAIGFGALFSAVTASQFHRFSAGSRHSFNAVSTSLGGIVFAQLAIGVLGVLVMSGEYSTGMIRSSLAVVPRRLPVLWAKITVFVVGVGFVALVTSFGAFFVGQALLSSQHLQASLSSPQALRMVIGSALYVTLAGIMGIAFGALFRSTAAGITTLVGLFFVLPPVLNLLPQDWTNHFAQYLPANAGQALWSIHRGTSVELSPWTGFAVMCLWAALLVFLAALRLRRTDT